MTDTDGMPCCPVCKSQGIENEDITGYWDALLGGYLCAKCSPSAGAEARPRKEVDEDRLRDAILYASEVLDPKRQGECWPDPIAWDGRPLQQQGKDLLARLDAVIDQRALWADDGAEISAHGRLRHALETYRGGLFRSEPMEDDR